MLRPSKPIAYSYVTCQATTLAVFEKRARKEFGAKRHVIKVAAIGPRGPHAAKYLSRKLEGGREVYAELPSIREDATLMPNVLRRLCDKLQIPREAFGITEGAFSPGPGLRALDGK